MGYHRFNVRHVDRAEWKKARLAAHAEYRPDLIRGCCMPLMMEWYYFDSGLALGVEDETVMASMKDAAFDLAFGGYEDTCTVPVQKAEFVAFKQ